MPLPRSQTGCGEQCYHSEIDMKLSRRRFLWATGGAGVSAAAYGYCWESKWLQLTCTKVPIAGPTDLSPLRILLLSDLHWSFFDPLEFLQSAFDLGFSQEPDLVCLAGDFVCVGNEYQLDEYRPLLESVSQTMPTYAVLGNHDGGSWSRRRDGLEDESIMHGLLQESGISVLNNDSVKLSVRGHNLRLVGVSDLWSGGLDPDGAFREVNPGDEEMKIVLAHNPDSKDYLGDFDWQLMLCGHTHGGQIAVPLLGAPHAPIKDKRFIEGLNPWRDRFIYTTRGVGSLYGTRLYCRPEVSIIDLV